ncbi:hypothetical protein Ocin01_14970 [Orchesella cincta]|uniref:Ricin B lectin domain-containing protein n=1 Tax=Orchesella cincta TaxID=48709 RepID=A0A1D2MFQ4_ORCCI|nr:hypothetical protein Ocin01_14970 [Orchesella cincta]
MKNIDQQQYLSCQLVSILLCLLIAIGNASALPSLEFKNGQFYTISSLATGKAMTVAGKQFKLEADIVTSPWIAQDNQLWLALAESTQSGKPVSNPEKFVLVPQRQSWDWKDFLETGKINATIESLPEETVVLTLDNNIVNLTQSLFNDSSSQKWITEDAGDGHVLIKNWGNQQCIKNFDLTYLSVYAKGSTTFLASQEGRKPPLGTLACNANDVSEKWLLEPVYVLKG